MAILVLNSEKVCCGTLPNDIIFLENKNDGTEKSDNATFLAMEILNDHDDGIFNLKTSTGKVDKREFAAREVVDELANGCEKIVRIIRIK